MAETPLVVEHREQLWSLLVEAPQIEHMIMCQYLNACFSLKTEPDEALAAEQADAVARWQETVTGIAIEEMLHLALVMNVMTAIGAAPTLSRPNFPRHSVFLPPGVEFALLPFGADSLTHFVYLERPEGMERVDAAELVLTRFFTRTDETDKQLDALVHATFGIMGGVLKPLGTALTRLPMGPGNPGRTAGAAFQMYYQMGNFVPWRNAAWVLLSERAAVLSRQCAECAMQDGVPEESAQQPRPPRRLGTARRARAARAAARLSIGPRAGGRRQPRHDPRPGERHPMTREPAEPLRLDYLIKAGTIHSMTGKAYRSVGLRGAEIVAVSAEADGLDDLVGVGTAVVDAGDLTLLPAFADSHEHLMEASRGTLLVPVEGARSVAEFTGMIADAARDAAPGKWISTSISWHESNLAENRLPTLAELDAAAPDNPVLARRGGHLAVVNSAALQAADIGPDTPDPLGGKIGRLPDGSRDGVLEARAVYQVAAFAVGPSRAELAAALGTTSAAYAALGVGTIREAMINLDELLAYQDARDRDLLRVRVRPMIRVGSELTEDAAIKLIDGLGARSGVGDDWLRIWGLKFVMDGGAEGAALEQPYANDPSDSGHLNWDPAVMTRVCVEAAGRGWRIGTHAVGDRALRTLLDVYEAVVAQVGPLPPWTLVIEHAMLSDTAQRARAVRGGFNVTVQHPVLWNMGSEMLVTWGPERTRQVSPIDQWLAAGASLAAGTDLVRPFNPMTNVWGMVTRGTSSAGIQGPEHAISVGVALELYTTGTAALNHEQDRLGSITPGKLADLVGYAADPTAADPDDLPGLTPAFTVVGGRATHDPDKRLARVTGPGAGE